MQRKVLGGTVQPKDGKLKDGNPRDDRDREIKPLPLDVDSIEFKVPEGAPDTPVRSEGVMLTSSAPNTGPYKKDDLLTYLLPRFKVKWTLKVVDEVGPVKYKVKRTA
ncbi:MULTISPECIES: hypothetical protein [unclassified Roseateles]|jgi:hypothetical protein|uniref:hypothetical protein n=1 Tax=unclassified Roseateles TaxID=2626991 RepID=UPI000701F73D|nr:MULTISPECIES: hypothetical protein [unclassified Roseateles]KQW50000.1 hypothetical protein ASC81_24700 [Pelomonas sp. Root405]KRA67400.1 hypothetical protein ASD88_24700 [Pelomonas sp. Root662]